MPDFIQQYSFSKQYVHNVLTTSSWVVWQNRSVSLVFGSINLTLYAEDLNKTVMRELIIWNLLIMQQFFGMYKQIADNNFGSSFIKQRGPVYEIKNFAIKQWRTHLKTFEVKQLKFTQKHFSEGTACGQPISAMFGWNYW